MRARAGAIAVVDCFEHAFHCPLPPKTRDDGVGLAAPQVGVNVRLMVFNEAGGCHPPLPPAALCLRDSLHSPPPLPPFSHATPRHATPRHAIPCAGERGKGSEVVLVNPRIVSAGGPREIFEEGCLSFPQLYADVVVRDGGALGVAAATALLPPPSLCWHPCSRLVGRLPAAPRNAPRRPPPPTSTPNLYPHPRPAHSPTHPPPPPPPAPHAHQGQGAGRGGQEGQPQPFWLPRTHLPA